MATVLVPAYGQNPAQTWPEKYTSCYWNGVTGWTCQTNDAPVSEPLPPLSSPDPTAVQPISGPVSTLSPIMVATSGRDCGCCGGARGNGAAVASGASPSLALSIAKQCRCGYTNKEAILALAVAFIVFLLVRE